MAREVEIEIRKLNRSLSDDYFELFDQAYDSDPFLRFDKNPGWGGCYCTFFDDPRPEDEINALPDKRNENRRNRRDAIERGKASGLMAYVNGKIAGWCNVAPRNSYANLRYIKRSVEDPQEEVGSITCFLVSSEWRKRGVATRLLESACDLIKEWKLPVAEGYPRNPDVKTGTDEVPSENGEFRGSINMFFRAGFSIHKRFGNYVVVRKVL